MSGLQTHSEGKGDFAQGGNKSVKATAPFNNDFYTYTVTMNSSFQKVGTFTLVTSDAAQCPVGRVLHFTGNNLVPGVHPMNTFVGGLSTAGVASPGKFMLKVYDPVTFLSGFIDPTVGIFSRYDQNLPNFYDLGTTGANPPLGGPDGRVSASQAANTSITGATATGAVAAGSASSGSITYAGTLTTSVVVSTTAVTSTSIIMLSWGAGTPTQFNQWVSAKSALTSFTISLSSAMTAGTTNWVIIN